MKDLKGKDYIMSRLVDHAPQFRFFFDFFSNLTLCAFWL